MEMEGIVKIAKTMKRCNVYVCPYYMLGSDEEYCSLSVIELNTESPEFAAKIVDILTPQNSMKFITSRPDIYYNEYRDVKDGYKVNAWDEVKIKDKLKSMHLKIMLSVTELPIVFYKDHLEQDQEFMDNVGKPKTADGLVKYNIDNFILTSFASLHSINAKDVVSLTIYDCDAISYLYEFKIVKKKYIIKEYLRYRKF